MKLRRVTKEDLDNIKVGDVFYFAGEEKNKRTIVKYDNEIITVLWDDNTHQPAMVNKTSALYYWWKEDKTNPIEEAKKLLEDAGYSITPPPEPIVVERWINYYRNKCGEIISGIHDTEAKANYYAQRTGREFLRTVCITEEF